MTTVSFHMEEGRITAFAVSGHSGYAEEGADIVCAAITSAVRLVECTLNEVLGLGAAVKVDEVSTEIHLHIPGGLSSSTDATCQTVLTGLMVYLTELRDEFPDYMTVLEV
jgi:hypothetical protein